MIPRVPTAIVILKYFGYRVIRFQGSGEMGGVGNWMSWLLLLNGLFISQSPPTTDCFNLRLLETSLRFNTSLMKHFNFK